MGLVCAVLGHKPLRSKLLNPGPIFTLYMPDELITENTQRREPVLTVEVCRRCGLLYAEVMSDA